MSCTRQFKKGLHALNSIGSARTVCIISFDLNFNSIVFKFSSQSKVKKGQKLLWSDELSIIFWLYFRACNVRNALYIIIYAQRIFLVRLPFLHSLQ